MHSLLYSVHVGRQLCLEYSVVGSSPTRGSSFFLGKVTALGVLCCFALFVCLTLLASFFLPSHLSFKNMYMYVHKSEIEMHSNSYYMYKVLYSIQYRSLWRTLSVKLQGRTRQSKQ